MGCFFLTQKAGSADIDLNVQAAMQSQSGGGLSFGNQAEYTRTAFQIMPTLTWATSGSRTATDLRLTSTLDLPSHAASGPMNNLRGEWRFRYAYNLNTLLETRFQVGHLSFDTHALWHTRTRISSDLGISTNLKPNLYFLGGYNYATSRYTIPPSQTGQTTETPQINTPIVPRFGPGTEFTDLADEAQASENNTFNRKDQRHRLRASLLWSHSNYWLTLGGHWENNHASLKAHGYRGLQFHLGGGFQGKKFGASVQTSRESRTYHLPENTTSTWRSLWLFTETTWQVKPSLKVFANIQKEYSNQNGDQAFSPWTFVSAGVRFSWPIKTQKRPQIPDSKPFEPHKTQTGWIFRYHNIEAKSVHLIGTFSSWNPQGYALKQNPKTRVWEITVDLKPGVYEYAFIIDGNDWIAPPQAAMYVDDGFGNRNGVLIVEDTTELTAR